jgi:hypothetical protein
MLYGTVPRYRHIKTFGCAAYTLKPHVKEKGKLASRSEKQWLLEYEATTIFRLWNPVKKIVRTSRDINFNKTELAPAKCIVKSTTSPTTSPTTESNAESDTDLNAESSIELTDQSTNFRPTTRSMTRKSTLQEAVGASKSTNTVDLAIVMPERDTEVEYEDWTTEVLLLAQAYYAATATTKGYNED